MSTFRKVGQILNQLASFAVNKVTAGHQSIIGQIVSTVFRSTGRAGAIRIRPPTMAQRQMLGKAVAGFRQPVGPTWRSWVSRIAGNAARLGRRVPPRVAINPAAWKRTTNQVGVHQRISLSSALAGLVYANKDAGMDGVFERVRDLFRNYCRVRTTEDWPKSLDGYDVGYWMAQGCNGVIYEARVRGREHDSAALAEMSASAYQSARVDNDDSEVATFSPGFSDIEYDRWLRRKEQYPLAIKLCFNFEFTNNSDRVLRTMDRERELVPATTRDIQGLLKWNRPIPHPHPNIVELKTAFVDDIRPLPHAEEKWPAALALGLGGQTLYMVMKRYTMTLRQYILLHRYTFHTARLLFGQLLEAITYLAYCQISHRDMKSNNILVDFDHPDEPPRLVLADFGSCLSSGDLKLPYTREGLDLGGNCALRAPEIACAIPGLDSYIDYSKADLWAAGTLAYEIFTKENPFYYAPPNGLSNITYTEDELKPLPKQVPLSVRRLVGQLLLRDPDERPTAPVAANVVALSLFRMEFLNGFLNKLNLFRSSSNGDVIDGYLTWKFALSDVASLFAAETILGRRAIRGDSMERWTLSKTEEQLRMTFLSRLDANSLANALRYFVES